MKRFIPWLQIILLVPFFAYASNNPQDSTNAGEIRSPNGFSAVLWKCTDKWHDDCSINVRNIRGKISSLWKEGRLPSGIEWLSNSLVQFTFGCGTDCYSWVFYNFDKGRSLPFDDAKAVDPKRLLVLAPAPDFFPSSGSPIVISVIEMFSGKVLQEIELKNPSPAGAVFSVILDAKFTNNGMVYIKYNTGKNHSPKEIYVPLNGV